MPSSAHEAANGDASELPKYADEIVARLREEQVNFVAFDFDKTIVEVHTCGKWTGSPEKLSERIRPMFRALIPKLLEGGVHVAVVTFSPQVTLISQVMRIAFPGKADQIPIRGEDSSWEYDGEGVASGKMAHMASAVEELIYMEKCHHGNVLTITRATSVLIDDDINNVSIALSEGVRAVWCNPADVRTVAHDLLLV